MYQPLSICSDCKEEFIKFFLKTNKTCENSPGLTVAYVVAESFV